MTFFGFYADLRPVLKPSDSGGFSTGRKSAEKPKKALGDLETGFKTL